MSPLMFPILFATSLAAHPEDRFVSEQGVRIHYQEVGSGTRTIVLIHGGAADATLWRHQMPVLAGYGRVVALDLPGHGRSDKPERIYDLDLFLAAVAATVRQAKTTEVIVVGQSLGGLVAYEYARRHRETVKGLIWVEGTFLIPRNVDEQRAAMKHRLEILRGPDYEERVLAMWESLFVTQTPLAVRDEIRGQLLATPRHVLISTMENLMTRPSLFELERLDIPALALFGAYWQPAEYEEAFRTYLPQLEMRVLPEVGHFPMLEKPEVVNDLLRGFLDRHFGR